METAGDIDGANAVIERFKDHAQFVYSITVRATGEPYIKRAADAHDISPLERSAPVDAPERTMRRQGSGRARNFPAPSRSAHLRNDGDLINDNSRVFNEYGVGELMLGREQHRLNSQLSETIPVSRMLPHRFLVIDRFPFLSEGQLTAPNTMANRPQ